MNFFKKQQSRPGLQRSRSTWRFGTRSNFGERRIIVGNKPPASMQFDQPDDSTSENEPQQDQFVGNQIKSSKYTILTFLPR